MGKPFAALACAVLLAACNGAKSSSTATATAAATGYAGPAHVGKPAPAWTQPLAGGGKLDFASLAGKPVYLNFFATWCGPCNDEAPAINALQKQYASAGLRVVGVDVLESEQKAEKFRAQYHLVYPAGVDDGTLRDLYDVNGLPVHAFIDRAGIVRNITVGQMAPDEIRAQVRAILK
jgi:thiol-disulfide isomerase/thioredoxin